jgi:molybdopterin adenylyltransferase
VGITNACPGACDGKYNSSVSVREHKTQGPVSVSCYILTVSDTRTPETDTSGRAIRALLQDAGHVVSGHDIERDDPDLITARLRERLADEHIHVLISTGGTGISPRDGTFEAVTALFEKRLDGFGELFRMISFEEIGSAAMLSRATAGTVGRKAIFALPGSEKAVRLAMTRLVLPELGHVVQQLSK